MNGYTLMADSYRKLMNEGKIDEETANAEIRIYEFLASCNQDDLCRMIDSSAFNDIIRGYVNLAVKSSNIDNNSQKEILNQLPWLFDTRSAKDVLGSL